jgi:acetyl-CoA synthetase
MALATSTRHTAAYWTAAHDLLRLGDRQDGLNIATAVVDRHVAEGRGGDVAIRCVPKGPAIRPVDMTYAELADASGRFAEALGARGVTSGATVAVISNRVPELYVAVLGAWKRGAVVCPLFSAFGPEPIRQRLSLGSAEVLVTSTAIYRRKIEPIRRDLPGLAHVILLDGTADALPAGTSSMAAIVAETTHPGPAARTTADDPALLHFTSGTTGTPKGAIHVHGAVVAHAATAADVFGLGPDDVYWCTADPGWVTGTSYGIIAPLALGARMIVDEAEFDAERWYALLARERVSVWYTAPTAIRMLMRAGDEIAARYDLSHLRVVASVGEPLSAEAVRWGASALGQPVRDTWWQTETGAIMIANRASADVLPGSMGRPIPGVTAALLACDESGRLELAEGHVVEIDDPQRIGMIAIRPGWPSMFRGYLDDRDRYEAAFVDGWYLSGDLARRDAAGNFWFVGRSDDVIKTAGHLIGPFEVEQVLNEHTDVVATGVYGLPDPVAGEIIMAEVVLRDGVAPTESTLSGIMAHARRHLGAAVAPRRIIPVDSLPYTRSGKVMRRLLKARALGLPEGDTSTLETAAGT